MPVRTVAILTVALLTSTALASDPVPVAVTDIISLGGVEAGQEAPLGEHVATAVDTLGRYKVLKMRGIRNALAIKGLDIDTRCSDEACLTILGKALGVRWLVAGSLMRFGGTYVLKLRIVDADKSLAIASTSNQVKGGEGALKGILPQAVKDLFASAAPKLHPKTAKAQKVKRQRTAAEKKSVNEPPMNGPRPIPANMAMFRVPMYRPSSPSGIISAAYAKAIGIDIAEPIP